MCADAEVGCSTDVVPAPMTVSEMRELFAVTSWPGWEWTDQDIKTVLAALSQSEAGAAALRQMVLALIYVDGTDVRETARRELDNIQAGAEFIEQLGAVKRALVESERHAGVSEAETAFADRMAIRFAVDLDRVIVQRDQALAQREESERSRLAYAEQAKREFERLTGELAEARKWEDSDGVVRGWLKTTIAERDDYAKALVMAQACAEGRALDALKALSEALGTFNAENPWLGVAASVALLQMDRDAALAECARLRWAILRWAQTSDAYTETRPRSDELWMEACEATQDLRALATPAVGAESPV